jgi:pyruvate dehydrogenase E1 component beta subunit
MLKYAEGILQAFEHVLSTRREVFAIGQGLWSPWYVGSSMKDLDRKSGPERVIDTPVSELACTGAAVGAALSGYRPIVIHPRMDFMILGIDPIVNQAAKWSYMFEGKAHPALTIRSIINRGGEQGAQHSQALHAWFAHIPGLRVAMPATARDARELLIASVLCDDPVLYIDDRWLYDEEEDVPAIEEWELASIRPEIRRVGGDVTLAAAGYSVRLCCNAATILAKNGISAEVVDLRVINPLNCDVVVQSVAKTGRLCAVDGGWSTCGLAGEVIASVAESLPHTAWKARPLRVTLPNAPAPSSASLEEVYYPTAEGIANKVRSLFG